MSTPASASPRVLVRATERGAPDSGSHPYNPRSEVHGWLLSRPAGLRRIAVNRLWVPAGKESSELHRHHREEEWVFVLEGRGVAEVDDAEHEIGPGDFLGFPPGVAHNLRAAPDARLDLLVGGEVITDVEVADFPRQRRRLARFGARFAVYPLEAEVPLFPGSAAVPPELLGAAPAASPRVLVRAAERGPEQVRHRPESPATEVRLTDLSRPAGLTRVAVGVTRVPAGRASWPKHLHHHDEEWLFVLSGQGIAEVGDEAHGIGPGDFLGFPAGGPAHQVTAGASDDLVFLHGGDAWSSRGVEIVDYPALGRRKTFTGAGNALTFSLDDALERRR
jgi:uncharacterized cupin superfamily protein